MTDNAFIVFNFKQLLESEKGIARDFNYTMSPTVTALIELMRNNKK